MSTQSWLECRYQALACAVLALALAAPSAASAQDSEPAAASTVASGPKQSGPWTIIGWKNAASASYCTAERRVQNAAGDGAAMQFAVVRLASGYRIALGSDEWELKPQSTFPVELVAGTALRSDAAAIAVAPKIVIIELGADRQVLVNMSAASAIEVKAAQARIKLPLDGLGAAVADLDACFTAFKRANANPFAAPPAAAKPPAAPAQSNSVPQAPARSGAAAPERPSPTLANAPASSPSPPAAAMAKAAAPEEFIEERAFLMVRDDAREYRLESLVVRPRDADGRLPVVLLTHGKNAKAAENQHVSADMMLPQARDFAARGYLAVVVIRRGYGRSDGLPGVSRGAAYMACGADQVGRGFDVEADDLDGALRVIAARPDADVSRVVVAGQSFGGGVALAFAARQPKGLVGVVNISGGVWRADGAGKTCVWDDLRHAFAAFGARVQVPTLWLYAENDALFPPEVVRELRDAFVNAGGKADLRMFKPVVGDGHLLFSDFTGRINWLRAFDEFLAANALPNVNTARAERVMQVTKLPAGARKAIDDYLAAPEPKAFAFAPAFKSGHWFAVPQGMSAARERALARCREKVGTDCTVVFENNTMVAPEPVTTRMTSN